MDKEQLKDRLAEIREYRNECEVERDMWTHEYDKTTSEIYKLEAELEATNHE